jgi:hypothetical protein
MSGRINRSSERGARLEVGACADKGGALPEAPGASIPSENKEVLRFPGGSFYPDFQERASRALRAEAGRLLRAFDAPTTPAAKLHDGATTFHLLAPRRRLTRMSPTPSIFPAGAQGSERGSGLLV